MTLDPVSQCRHLLATYDKLLDGLDDSHRALEPHPGNKTAGWIIGHLAVTGDYARKLCGQKPICPAEWRPKFNPGTQPSTNPAEYPPMSELVARFRDVYSDLPDAYASASPESLLGENPFAPGRGAFPTPGHFAAYLMTGHLGYHLGQLYGWRAASRVK